MLNFELKTDHKKFLKFIHERQIEYLVHFTLTKHLAGIVEQGCIYPRSIVKTLELDFIQFPDDLRLDYKEDYINLSIGRPNRFLFRKFQERLKECPDVSWCILKIIPDYIYAKDTLFSVSNAASSFSKNVYGISGDFEKLQMLYKETLTIGNMFNSWKINRHGLHSSFPTDNQAEVLVKDKIAYEDVLNVCFQNEEELKNTISAFKILKLDTSKFIVDDSIFK